MAMKAAPSRRRLIEYALSTARGSKTSRKSRGADPRIRGFDTGEPAIGMALDAIVEAVNLP
jgi:hypothetical protein